MCFVVELPATGNGRGPRESFDVELPQHINGSEIPAQKSSNNNGMLQCKKELDENLTFPLVLPWPFLLAWHWHCWPELVPGSVPAASSLLDERFASPTEGRLQLAELATWMRSLALSKGGRLGDDP